MCVSYHENLPTHLQPVVPVVVVAALKRQQIVTYLEQQPLAFFPQDIPGIQKAIESYGSDSDKLHCGGLPKDSSFFSSL
jgi:hypothetical protein